jgi:simple sugar transport system substrate-binding protein
VLDEALKENGDKFDAGYVFVAGFRPLELRRRSMADVKKAHPGIQESALWGAVDSNTATTVASQTAAALRADPDITVVFAPYDEFARGVKLGAAEAGVADKIKVYSADVSTTDIQEIHEPGSSWWRPRPPIPPLSAEVSLRALALLIAGQDPGKVVEVKPVLITREALEKNGIKTVQDLDKKLPGLASAISRPLRGSRPRARPRRRSKLHDQRALRPSGSSAARESHRTG